MTVPACVAHNNDNAKDVEYVRNVICIQYGTNAAAEEVAETAKRSWDHSEKLFAKTFHDIEAAEVIGEGEIGLFTVDLARVKNVVSAIAHALYSLDFGKPAPANFEVFCAFHSKASLQGKPDGTERLGKMLANAKYEDGSTPYPEVFEYKIHHGKDCVVFALGFYEKLWCYAWIKTN